MRACESQYEAIGRLVELCSAERDFLDAGRDEKIQSAGPSHRHSQAACTVGERRIILAR
jgi:hypothetical protein